MLNPFFPASFKSWEKLSSSQKCESMKYVTMTKHGMTDERFSPFYFALIAHQHLFLSTRGVTFEKHILLPLCNDGWSCFTLKLDFIICCGGSNNPLHEWQGFLTPCYLIKWGFMPSCSFDYEGKWPLSGKKDIILNTRALDLMQQKCFISNSLCSQRGEAAWKSTSVASDGSIYAGSLMWGMPVIAVTHPRVMGVKRGYMLHP